VRHDEHGRKARRFEAISHQQDVVPRGTFDGLAQDERTSSCTQDDADTAQQHEQRPDFGVQDGERRAPSRC